MRRKNFILVATILGMSLVCAKAENSSLQDTQKAAQYFEEQLNFHMNSYALKAVQKGKTTIADKEVKVVIIDVRDEASFKEGHIPGAINLPYDKYQSFNGPETEYPGLIKDGYNVVYCYTADCNLSIRACKKFASLGYPVKELRGNFEGWQQHQYPIEK